MNPLHSWLQDRLLGRVLKNSSYLFASYVLGGLLTLLTARLLGAASFGVLGTISVFSSNINRLFSFRMSELVVRYVSHYQAENRLDKAAAVVKAAALTEALTSRALQQDPRQGAHYLLVMGRGRPLGAMGTDRQSHSIEPWREWMKRLMNKRISGTGSMN